jgi:hypothetical protein
VAGAAACAHWSGAGRASEAHCERPQHHLPAPPRPHADLLQADASRYRCFKDYQRLHDAILQHVCLATPALAAAFSDEGAAQQVRAALASLFPVAAAATFVTASAEERLGQLQELARATLGICCLHQATGEMGGSLAARCPGWRRELLPPAAAPTEPLAPHCKA